MANITLDQFLTTFYEAFETDADATNTTLTADQVAAVTTAMNAL
jgi:hypothetical protein